MTAGVLLASSSAAKGTDGEVELRHRHQPLSASQREDRCMFHHKTVYDVRKLCATTTC